MAGSGTAVLVKRRLSGVLFLAVLVGLVALSVLLYNKAFTPVVEVTLQASAAGNQLSAPSDVKLRGLIVGEVREITTTGDGAELRLALDPDQVELIPSNVQARLLPKTLFGEKYVDLVIPEDADGDAIGEGDVIPQDRSEVARETEQTLNDLLPLLRALKPAQVSLTLNAVSGALRGRGDQIGENLVLVDTYLKGINPEIPALGENFRGIADFADNLERTTPDIVEVLDNLSAISGNLVDQEQELNTFLTSTTGFSEELGSFLEENDERLITLARDSRPVLETFARYAPEFPCLARGLAKQETFLGPAFGGLQPGLHITLEFAEDQNGYTPNQDEPQYKDDRGPECYGLPNPTVPAPDINFQDGFRDDQGPADSSSEEGGGGGTDAASDPAVALSSPQGQRQVMGAVLGPVLGVAPADVPDLAFLLFGPMARGTEVGLS
ncbi:MAG: mammalian cell entry protein [Frankiales bacterium]|jgi:phospholipid/cholesterol/gamma-HCH transport system substrate-binding protein|nr:mammalian cell entry protein [Frankiales bacterium]